MRSFLVLSGSLLCSTQAFANIEEITIYGHRTGLIGDAISASSGIIGQGEIENRPMLRSAEMLELIPGMAVTQHSGSGKANQYFIRGFNLDHDIDYFYASRLAGEPADGVEDNHFHPIEPRTVRLNFSLLF